MILLIDHKDSFVYNVADLVARAGGNPEVRRHDELEEQTLETMQPEAIILSPGPGHPQEYPFTLEVIRKWAGRVPILGICLGHQALAHAYGGKVDRGKEPVHGKASRLFHDGRGLFAGLSNPVQGVRYHSLVVDPESLSEEFSVTAFTPEGEVMGIRHRSLPLEGVQFHPESIKTDHGLRMLQNFLNGRMHHAV